MADQVKAYQKVLDRGVVRDSMDQVDFDSPFSRENPLAGQRYYDKKASELAETIAGRTPDYFEKNLTRGLLQSEVPDYQAPPDDAMADAIAGRYDSAYKDSLRGIMSETRANAPVMSSASQARGGQMAGAIRQNEIQNYNEQAAFQAERKNIYNQWVAAKDAAKSSLLGSIFSGIGAIGGAIIGGPAGAIAGAAVGGTAAKA
jgi:hypothetical protein